MALVLPGRCHAAGCVVRGAGARTATAGETSCFHVQARSRWSARKWSARDRDGNHLLLPYYLPR
eukprot:scaffold80262_cov42-Phaeocystis_antarctica.AAC.2